MNKYLVDIINKISEGVQSSSAIQGSKTYNVFHRPLVEHSAEDLSFINGWVATGLRGSAIMGVNDLSSNFEQLSFARHQLLPLVVNTHVRNSVKDDSYDIISNLRNTRCFQLVASSPLEEIYFTLIAHKISELSLIPGLVIGDYLPAKSDLKLPADDIIIKYLGSPDDYISCPTPGQEIIFGKTRRRIPHWYSFDLPAMLGSIKEGKAFSMEAAAYNKYIWNHLPEIIERAFDEFNVLMDLSLSPLNISGKSSKRVIFTVGGQLQEKMEEAITSSKGIQWVKLGQLHPLPLNSIGKVLENKESASILDCFGTQDSWLKKEISLLLRSRKTELFTAKYDSDLSGQTLENYLQKLSSGHPETSLYLDIPLSKSSSSFPKHEVLIQEIDKQYPLTDQEFIATSGKKDATSAYASLDVPLTIRRYKDKGPEYSRLSRFYDHVGLFYKTGNKQELIADPFSALPLIPAGAADLLSCESREQLPLFNPLTCTGCGDCFIKCPHSAIPPIVIGVESLLKAGADIVTSKGESISRLTPMMKNIAKVAASIIADKDVSTAADFLPESFEGLITKIKLEGEKLDETRKEFDLVFQEVRSFPLSVTKTFFTEPNTIDKGTGELFSVAIDPNACTGCSICAEACTEEAISMVAQNTENENITASHFKLWEQLPDTLGSSINRVYSKEDYPSLAAILLSRNYYKTTTGASLDDSWASAKTMIHLAAATTEAVVQPRMVEEIKKIDILINSLTEQIHKNLSDAIPDQSLETIAESLRKSKRKKVRIKDVLDHVDDEDQARFLDAAVLQRKTKLAMDLKQLKDQLAVGPTGMGRSRYGLVVGGNYATEFIGKYPYNNFTTPCIIHPHGESTSLTQGLIKGQTRYVLDHIKLLRRAELEIKNKYEPTIHDIEISGLTWDDLTDEEKRLVPPILLISDTKDSHIIPESLSADGYPCKLIYIEDGCSSSGQMQPGIDRNNNRILSSISNKKTFIFQGGIANSKHLFEGLMDGMDKLGPAIFNLYSINIGAHDISLGDWTQYAALVRDSRTFPYFRYDPSKGKSIQYSFDLDGDQNPDETWTAESIELPTGETIHYKITWADWAYTQRQWKDHFIEVEKESNQLLMAEYIALKRSSREGKNPVILRQQGEHLQYYQVSKDVVKATENVLSQWNTLCEIAGRLTEYPDKLRAGVSKEIQDQFDLEKLKLEEEYEAKLQAMEASQAEILRKKLKEKLIALARMNQNKMKV